MFAVFPPETRTTLLASVRSRRSAGGQGEKWTWDIVAPRRRSRAYQATVVAGAPLTAVGTYRTSPRPAGRSTPWGKTAATAPPIAAIGLSARIAGGLGGGSPPC